MNDTVPYPRTERTRVCSDLDKIYIEKRRHILSAQFDDEREIGGEKVEVMNSHLG